MARYQSQMNAETTAGHRAALSRHTPAIVTDDTQVNSGFALFDYVLPVSTGGGFGPRLFSIPIARRLPPVRLRIGDRLSSSLPARKLVAALSRGGPEGVRFDGAPLFRHLNIQLRKHADRQIANAFEAHSISPFVVAVSNDDHPNERIPQHVGHFIQGRGND